MPIGTIIGGISSIFGSGMSYKGQKDTNKTNIQLAQQGREHDVNMWNRQNEYNTPEMQMHRLKEAGLNPNLMYGNGQASTGNADAPKQAHVATTSNEMASFANNNAIQMLSQYNDWQVKKAQIQNIQEETTSKALQNQFMSASMKDRLFGEEWKSNLSYAKAKYQDELYVPLKYTREERAEQIRNQSKLSGQRLNESSERINFLQKSSRQKQLQIELDEQLKPHGMSTSDQLWQRMLAPVIKDKFGGFMDFMNDPKQHFKNTFNKNKKK